MLVLARKWRPKNFDEVAGQEAIVRTIKNSIQYNQVAQAYLFSGPRGSGKTTMARLLAKAMNCLKGPTINPCNECSSCKEIALSTSMDVIEIDGASNRGIDEVRELRELAKYRHSRDKYKIIIIDEVHMLTTEAFNALLKILEEPPPHIIFIFATTELRKVPNTITSRCLGFEFKRLNPKDIRERLNYIIKEEGIQITEGAISMLVRAAEGSLRDALSILDQLISYAGNKIDTHHIIELLGFLSIDSRFELTNGIIEGNLEKSIRILQDFYEKGYDPKTIYYDLCEHFHNLIIIKNCPDRINMLAMDDNESNLFLMQAKNIDSPSLTRLLNILLNSNYYLRQSEHPSIYLEMIIAKLCQIKSLVNLEEIISKIGMMDKHSYEKKVSKSTGLLFDDSNLSSPSKKKLKLEEVNPFEEKIIAIKESEYKEEANTENLEMKRADINEKILEKIMEIKPQIGALLNSVNRIQIEDRNLIIALYKNDEVIKFQLEKEENQKIIKEAVKEYLGYEPKVIIKYSEMREQISNSNKMPERQNNLNEIIEKEPSIKKALEIFKGTIVKIE